MPPNSLNKILLATVDVSLSTLGYSPKQAIFCQLEACFNISEEQASANLTKFPKRGNGKKEVSLRE